MTTEVKQAKLILEFRALSEDESMEMADTMDVKVDAETVIAGIVMTCNVEALSKEEVELWPDQPDTFLQNGILLAFVEQLIDGLRSKRGISMEEAAEKAAEKWASAERCIRMREMLGTLALSLSEPAGKC